jgi:uncharacterized RDD family membrane protein YckC
MNDLQNPSNPFAPPPPPAYDPYRAPQAAVAYQGQASANLELAEAGTRLVSRLLDGLIGFGVALPGMLLLFAGAAGGSGEFSVVSGLGLLLIFAGLIGLLIYNIRMLAESGQTIARKKMGIRIVRSNGEQATLGRLIGYRWGIPTLIGVVPLVGFLFSLVNILMIFRQDRRCAHDHIADTIVVKA